ncbi:aminoglycoside phosphotransferase [Stackebrandtia nassauensis DSM 44728]|uniref:Aminoglycoside phosphotransferase n=1 Tax=Stackebrandtia nassauensis (strain DSM 44728 / CIP 108903 / NRRL B-16338 / NBRC 102104 / LLR-40K-21) TaxID=446470 RepID=D3QBL2_STANL|nr:aminoglycoside phosphotransferase [Stackebrandtia nassauensis DSM 44728]
MCGMTSLVDTALRLTYPDYRWRRLEAARPILGVRTYALTGRYRLVVKIALEEDLIDEDHGPCGEARRLAWLAGHGIPVPEVVDTGVMGDDEYLVLRLPDDAVPADQVASEQRLAACDAVADVARAVHGIDHRGCPFDRRLRVTIPRAKEACLFAEIRSRDPMAKLTSLIAKALWVGREEPVVCHGDLRPDSVLIDARTRRVAAVLDVARLGVADRYTDLAAATRGWRAGGLDKRVWWRYGEIPADADRVRLYRLLAEFCLPRPGTGRVEPRQDGGDVRRCGFVRQLGHGVPGDPTVFHQRRGLVVLETFTRQVRGGGVDTGQEIGFGGFEHLALPAHRHRHVDGTRRPLARGQAGFLGQFAPGGLRGRLTGFDAAAGRLPQQVGVDGVTPAQHQDPVVGVQAQHAGTLTIDFGHDAQVMARRRGGALAWAPGCPCHRVRCGSC